MQAGAFMRQLLTSRVVDGLAGLNVEQIDHEAHDWPRGIELAKDRASVNGSHEQFLEKKDRRPAVSRVAGVQRVDRGDDLPKVGAGPAHGQRPRAAPAGERFIRE